jgi:hypothetical protein
MRRSSVVLLLVGGSLLPGSLAVAETEPNDSKAQANLVALPASTTPAVLTGNSQAPSAFDYFRVTTAAQASPGFYRHRLTLQSANLVGLSATLRGLTQSTGVINAGTDPTLQSSGSAVGDKFVQWYTAQASADLYVRVTGVSTTTDDYTLDYEVTPVTEIVGPTINGGSRTITTVGQTVIDTDLWVYDAARLAIPNYGNDDESVAGGGSGTTSQSLLTRTYGTSTFFLVLSRSNLANSLASFTDDDQRNGVVLDFPGAVATSDDATTAPDLDVVIDGTLLQPVTVPPRQVLFIRFSVATPVELLDFGIE